jgi:putative transposase
LNGKTILNEICSRNSGRRSTVVDPTVQAVEAFCKQLDGPDMDVLRELVKVFVERLMSEQVDGICGAPCGERSETRVNKRNGYRSGDVDTPVGTIDVQIPKRREGSYSPTWLVEPRRRAERALVAVVAECYVRGISTRRVDGLVKTLGIEGISKSRVSEMAMDLDEMVEVFRNRPLDGGPYTYVWIDALTQKVREAGRICSVAALVATVSTPPATARSWAWTS